MLRSNSLASSRWEPLACVICAFGAALHISVSTYQTLSMLLASMCALEVDVCPAMQADEPSDMFVEQLVLQYKADGKGCLYAVQRKGLATVSCQCQPMLLPGPFVQP